MKLSKYKKSIIFKVKFSLYQGCGRGRPRYYRHSFLPLPKSHTLAKDLLKKPYGKNNHQKETGKAISA
jgi:hypothetical protein